MSRRALTGVLVVLSLTTASGQQTRQPAAPPTPQTPTFKVEVEYVGVDVRVTDSKGNFVRDLTKEDFQIVEDGRPQTIDAFSLIDIPIDQPVSRSVPIAPDVQSNERPLDGRVYVMILDDASHFIRPVESYQERRAPVHRAASWRERSDGDRFHVVEQAGPGVHER